MFTFQSSNFKKKMQISINMFRIYLIVTILFISVRSVTKVNYAKYKYKSDVSNFSHDLPQKSDLIIYLKSLRRIMKFCSNNKYDLDLNFAFGLFLVNVNLKRALKNTPKTLPISLLKYMSIIIHENDEMVKFFENMVAQNKETKEQLNKMIISLFSNESKWVSRIRGLDTSLIKQSDVRTRSRLEDRQVTINAYMVNVDNVDRWVPQPRLSDLCMASLASNRDHHSMSFPRCELYRPCYDMLLNGTNFGYALSHRLLFLINARHSRGCSVYSEEEDRELTSRFCGLAYDESKFIATKSYKIIDLILEFISLCAIDGHAQFLRRDWILSSLRFQTPYGCFGMYLPDLSTIKLTSIPRATNIWKLAKHRNHQILGGICNGHVTSVAAAALSAAIRYTLDTHY